MSALMSRRQPAASAALTAEHARDLLPAILPQSQVSQAPAHPALSGHPPAGLALYGLALYGRRPASPAANPSDGPSEGPAPRNLTMPLGDLGYHGDLTDWGHWAAPTPSERLSDEARGFDELTALKSPSRFTQAALVLPWTEILLVTGFLLGFFLI